MGGRFSDRSLHLVLVVGNLIWGSEGSAALAERPSHECAETRGLRPGGARSSGHASPLDRARPRPTWPGAAPKHLARSAPLVTPRKYQSTLRKLAEVLRKPYARVEPFSGMTPDLKIGRQRSVPPSCARIISTNTPLGTHLSCGRARVCADAGRRHGHVGWGNGSSASRQLREAARANSPVGMRA
jgi:hypothetical protein